MRAEFHDARVSVIIPNRNNLDTLPAALASVEAQQFPGMEIIVVDDGSTDGSREWLYKASRNNPALRVLHTDGAGPSDARNEAISVASAEIIAFLDSDDTWERGKLRIRWSSWSAIRILVSPSRITGMSAPRVTIAAPASNTGNRSSGSSRPPIISASRKRRPCCWPSTSWAPPPSRRAKRCCKTRTVSRPSRFGRGLGSLAAAGSHGTGGGHEHGGDALPDATEQPDEPACKPAPCDRIHSRPLPRQQEPRAAARLPAGAGTHPAGEGRDRAGGAAASAFGFGGTPAFMIAPERAKLRAAAADLVALVRAPQATTTARA